MNSFLSIILFVIILFLACVIYFLPTICARDKDNFNGVAILNRFLGWTFLGWVISLAWAVQGKKIKIKKN